VVLLPQNERFINQFLRDLKEVAKSPSVKLD
jgi:hypothetical protein